MNRLYCHVALILLLCSCQNGGYIERAGSLVDASHKGRCQNARAVLDTDFAAGNIASCSVDPVGQFNVLIAPEDDPPINCSAWYAFRLSPKMAGEISVNMDYTACGHRYQPKLSRDGQNWTYLAPENVDIDASRKVKSAQLRIDLGKAPVFIAAQELLLPDSYASWLDKLTASSEVTRFTLGHSLENRPIEAIRFSKQPGGMKEQVVLLGRQHPPEVSGALAMLAFVEELLADTVLAKRYRARFETTVIPILNPDGVVGGYWRHNSGSTDLNRDWGPFTQPETRLMQRLLQAIADDPARSLRLFVDFHSTQKDVFYTIPDSLPTNPPHYAKNWLDRYQTRMGDSYPVLIEPSKNLEMANSKNYVHKIYGVPAVTFEVGDETDRLLVDKIGRESAIAMMETLLKTVEPSL